MAGSRRALFKGVESDLHLAVGDGKIDYAEFMYLVREYGVDASVLIETDSAEKAERSLKYLAGVKPHKTVQGMQGKLEKLIDIGIALTAERDPDKLFDLIVDTAIRRCRLQTATAALYIFSRTIRLNSA